MDASNANHKSNRKGYVMKKNKLTLNLNRETLRMLTGERLQEVDGGLPRPTTIYNSDFETCSAQGC